MCSLVVTGYVVLCVEVVSALVAVVMVTSAVWLVVIGVVFVTFVELPTNVSTTTKPANANKY